MEVALAVEKIGGVPFGLWCAHDANHVDRVANIDDDLRPGCDLDIDKTSSQPGTHIGGTASRDGRYSAAQRSTAQAAVSNRSGIDIDVVSVSKFPTVPYCTPSFRC